MADVSTLILSVDSTFDKEIQKGKKDFDERVKAINEINDMPDSIISMGGVSKRNLANGALDEARKVRRECVGNMERALDKALKEMNALKGDPVNGSAIIRLTERLEDWINRFGELTIPKSSLTSAERCSAGTKYEAELKKWQTYCKEDPIMKKAKSYEKKATLEEEIKTLREKKIDLEERIPKKQAELEDRKENESKYEEEVREAVKEELDGLDTEIRRAKQDLSDKEMELSDLQQQLSKVGIFAMGKKKELKAQIDSKTPSIDEAKKKLADLEVERKEKEEELPTRIANLASERAMLSEEILVDIKELEEVSDKLEVSITDLDRLEEELK